MAALLPARGTPAPSVPTGERHLPVRLVWLFVAGVLLAHTAIRWGLSRNLDLDEAEQLVLVQTWSAGYSVQPPLYTWLLWPLVQLVGANVLALALLKLLLLGTLFVLMARVARQVFPDARYALAAATPLLLPVIGWEAWRMTHTPLLCVMCLATVLAVLRLRNNPGWMACGVLGGCLGLGMLTKYNYAVFALALALACCTIPAYRARLLHPRLFFSLLVAALILAPHAWWGWEHRAEILDYLRTRTGLGSTPGGRSLGRGLGGFVLSLAVGLSVPAGAVFFASCRSLWQWLRPAGLPETYRLIMTFVAITLGLYLALVIVGGVKDFRVHWFAPLLLLMPFWFFHRGLAAPSQQRFYFALVVLYSLGVLGVRGSAFVRDYEAGKYQSRDHLYAALAEDVTAGGHQPRMVITQDILSAGYARLYFPEAPVYCQCYLTRPGMGHGWNEGIILWDSTGGDAKVDAMLERWRGRLGEGVHVGPANFIHTSRKSTATRTTHLGYAVVRKGASTP
jgi:4-amino-4-deoxy-L-arabinose transferase-like glycosyltransferase